MHPKPESRPRKHRRRLLTPRRFVYLVSWTAIVAALYGVIGIVAWHALRDYGDHLATIAWGGGTVQYEHIEVSETGAVEIEGLRVGLSPRAGDVGEPSFFSADRVRLRINLDNVRNPTVDSLEIDAPKLTIAGNLLGTNGAGKEPSPASAAEPLALPDWLRVGSVKIRDGEVKMAVAGLPSLVLKYDLEIAGLDGSLPDTISSEPLRLTLRDLDVKDLPGGSRASLAKADAEITIGSDLKSGTVANLRLDGLDAKVTAALWDTVFSNETPPPREKSAPLAWKINAFDIVGARIETEAYSAHGVFIPDARMEIDAELRGLDLADSDRLSGEIQSVHLRNVLLDASKSGLPTAGEPPLFTLAAAEVRVVPADLLRAGWIESLTLRDPVLSLDDQRVSLLTDFLAVPTPVATEPPPASPDAAPLVYKARHLAIEDGLLDAAAGRLRPGLPSVSTRFSLETLGTPDGASALYALTLADLRVEENEEAEQPFGRGQRVTARFTPEGVQRNNRIESIDIEGLDVTIGDALLRLEEAFAAAAPTPDAPPVSDPAPVADNPPWRAGRVALRDSRITLVDLVPGLPFVPINLETTLDEVPLTDQGRGVERLQRIELSRLEVTSPYDSLTPVANLKTIFIEFTFPGLIRSEIESVEIVSPEVFVGEPLFWYIDYYRGLGEDEETAVEPEPEPEPAPPPDATEPGTIAALEDAFNKASFSGWKIKRIRAHSGKIIVAPKGQPLGIFPFPFSFETDLEKRLLSVRLTVQSGDYVFEKLEAELIGLKGESFFNYPIRDKDNNFVQTFTALGLRFKEYEAQKVSLTVTYDRAGIYGKLWSAAYGGDLNAEFNIYIGDPYKWDAWASAAHFDLGPFTDAIAPDSFRMKGVLDGKFIANGEDFSIARAYGDAALGEGTMHITKLDDFAASLPEGWNQLQKAITTAGIDVFRNYDFSEGRAALDLTGRSGTASLFLGGPDGVRDLAFRFFDERAVAAASAKKESPVPVAAP